MEGEPAASLQGFCVRISKEGEPRHLPRRFKTFSYSILLNDFHPNLPMSCSKPLPPFVCDSLYYLNRNQLERFSIVCRPLKNFIDRYLHTKPYRVFDRLYIRGGSYALIHPSYTDASNITHLP
ncbi:hypothetical protein Ddc_13433 [Ditylenchus destructor]|nr:hypothetical protein Ddc_13433 [Ditylenchus destructor]